MANALLVGYDLNQPGQNYDDLWAHLKSSGTWWHYLDSTWIVVTDLTPVQLRDQIYPRLVDPNDELLVLDITGDAAAWVGFDDEAANWLKQHL